MQEMLMDEELAPSSKCLCRICHEEEEESSTRMESPCACSGTVKFAHRECIQRWCDEKGSNVCEICLQVFEPGYTYTVPQTKSMVDVIVSNRESLEIPESPEFVNASDVAVEFNFAECSAAQQRSASFCRSVAAMFTIMLLIRHFFAVTMVEVGQADDEYTFGIIITVLLLRACGIIFPFFLVMRLISMIQRAQMQYQLQQFRSLTVSHCLYNSIIQIWLEILTLVIIINTSLLFFAASV
ncbi:hypothetical protein Cni_G09003 [Canna indica]|uniref:RING-CH-type domain-containing protein n=1 Tax=Canna indica TaxID=4628 RepID=A0AAQ3K3F3_9LILI|nr:hypothetical protein Cni_G09003 [Canna indica]